MLLAIGFFGQTICLPIAHALTKPGIVWHRKGVQGGFGNN
jgi:hypothetical protein